MISDQHNFNISSKLPGSEIHIIQDNRNTGRKIQLELKIELALAYKNRIAKEVRESVIPKNPETGKPFLMGQAPYSRKLSDWFLGSDKIGNPDNGPKNTNLENKNTTFFTYTIETVNGVKRVKLPPNSVIGLGIDPDGKTFARKRSLSFNCDGYLVSPEAAIAELVGFLSVYRNNNFPRENLMKKLISLGLVSQGAEIKDLRGMKPILDIIRSIKVAHTEVDNIPQWITEMMNGGLSAPEI